MSDLAGPLEERLHYSFRDRSLLQRALTHKSYLHQRSSDVNSIGLDNEQLEFLGDSVLGFLISEWLLTTHPDLSEGDLSKRKATLVSAAHLHAVALSLDLGRYLLLGPGEERTGGREKRALLSDAMEAIIAALYVDGGIEAARRCVVERVVSIFDDTLADGHFDFKSALQERAQQLGLAHPRYLLVKQDGPEHAKTFTVEARLGEEWWCHASGSSKKSAGQRAAEDLLRRLAR